MTKSLALIFDNSIRESTLGVAHFSRICYGLLLWIAQKERLLQLKWYLLIHLLRMTYELISLKLRSQNFLLFYEICLCKRRKSAEVRHRLK